MFYPHAITGAELYQYWYERDPAEIWYSMSRCLTLTALNILTDLIFAILPAFMLRCVMMGFSNRMPER